MIFIRNGEVDDEMAICQGSKANSTRRGWYRRFLEAILPAKPVAARNLKGDPDNWPVRLMRRRMWRLWRFRQRNSLDDREMSGKATSTARQYRGRKKKEERS